MTPCMRVRIQSGCGSSGWGGMSSFTSLLMTLERREVSE